MGVADNHFSTNFQMFYQYSTNFQNLKRFSKLLNAALTILSTFSLLRVTKALIFLVQKIIFLQTSYSHFLFSEILGKMETRCKIYKMEKRYKNLKSDLYFVRVEAPLRNSAGQGRVKPDGAFQNIKQGCRQSSARRGRVETKADAWEKAEMAKIEKWYSHLYLFSKSKSCFWKWSN